MKKIFTSLLLIVLITSQVNFNAYADSVNMVSTHNNVHEAVSGFNAQTYNPGTDINNILNSVVSPHLDLNSVLHNLNVGHLNNETAINVGGHNLEINSNQTVTASEAIALAQVLSSGHQSLILNINGEATGGNLNASLLGNNINNFVLPNAVTLVDNSHLLTLTGNLANYGDIQFTGNASLTANNIYNATTGEIQGNNNLTINTSQALINEGTIVSNNTLAINTPVIYNAGAIESINGNLNIANVNTLDLTASAQNGNVEALNGSINLSENSGLNSNGINLVNGNYLSKELNIEAGNTGYVQGIIGNVSGVISTVAGSEHLAAATKDMLLGNSNIFGDPTYVNTAGDISLNGAVTTSGNNLAILAYGNIIVATSSNASINTQGVSGSGNLVMIAGLGSNVTATAGTVNSSTVPTGGTPITSSETVTVTLGAANGYVPGVINLVTNNTLANNGTVINTSALAGNAGNITLLAYSASGNGGNVLLSGTSGSSQLYEVNASGTGTGSNGNILILSTAVSGTDVELGTVVNNGGSGGGGNIALYTAYPLASILTFDYTGSITAGSIAPSSPLAYTSGGSIQLDGNMTAGNNVLISTGSSSAFNTGTNTIFDPGTLNIITGSGSFSTSTTPLLTNTPNLTANISNGSFYVNDSASSLTLSVINVINNTFSIDMTATNGSVIVSNTVNAGNNTIDITASGLGTITSSGGSLDANNVNLYADTGNIGTSNSSTLAVIATNLSVNSIGASSYITDTTNTNIQTSTIGSNGTYFLNTGSATNNGIFINSSLSIGGSASNIILIANGSGAITSGGSSDALTANNIALTSANASIGTAPSLPVYINAANINAVSSNSSVYLSDAATQTTITGGSVASNATYYLFMSNVNGGSIINNTALSAGSDTQTGTIILTASGSGTITNGTNGTITANTLELNSAKGNIGGSQTSPLIFDTLNLYANSTNANAYLATNVSNLNLFGSTVTPSGVFYLDNTSGSITVSGIVAAGSDSQTGTVTLQAGTASTPGAILATTNGTLTAGTINLTTPDGSIGSNSANTVQIDTVNIFVTSSANAFLTDSAGTVNVSSTNISVGSTGTFSLATNNSLNGSIVINGNLTVGTDTSSSVVSLASNGGSGTITFTNSQFVVTAGSIVLNTTAVGASNAHFLIDTSNLSATLSSGSAYLTDSATALTINNITVPLNNTITVNMSDLASGSINIVGNVSISANDGSGSINLTASGTGNITSNSGSLITAGSLSLITSSGSIGSGTHNLLTDTDHLTVTAGGSSYVSDLAASVTLQASTVSNSGTYSFDMTSPTGGTVNVVGAITAGSDSQTGTISLTANGIITNTASALLQANTISLNTQGENIGSSIPLLFYVDGSNLSLTTLLNGATTGSAFITDTAPVITLTNGSVSNLGELYLVNSTLIINPFPNLGGIDIGTVTGGTIYLEAATTGNIQSINSSSLVTATTSLTLTTISGNFGQSTSLPLLINAPSISLNNSSTSGGNAYISDNASSLTVSSFTIFNTNAIFDIVMTNATAGSININSNIVIGTDTATSSVTLVSSGTGGITFGTNFTQPLTAGAITLVQASGSLGTVGAPFTVDTGALSVTANSSANDTVYINDNSPTATALTINTSSAGSAGVFSVNLVNGGNMIIGGSITAGTDTSTSSIYLSTTTSSTGNGSITSASSSNVLTAGNVSLSTSNGDIGSSVTPIALDAGSLIVSTGLAPTAGSGYFTDTASSLSIGTSSIGNAASTLDVTMTNATAGSINVIGNITSSADTGTSVIDLTASGTGTINTSTGISLTAGLITLTSGAGDIGSFPSTPLAVDTGALTVTSNANALINDSANSVQINASSVNTTTGIYQLSMTSTNGSIVIAGTVNAATVGLTASGTGTITDLSTNFSLTGVAVDLTTTGGNIGAANNLVYINSLGFNITTGNTVSAASAYIGNSYKGTVNIGSTDFIVGSSGTIELVMNNSTIGGLSITSSLTAGTITLGISGGGVITASSSSDILTATNINLSSGGGNIGSNTSNLMINGANLSLNSSSNSLGTAFITDNQAASLSASKFNAIDLTTTGINGSINVNGATQANTLNLTSSGNGYISVNNVISGLSSGNATSVTLTANGSGNIINQVNSANPQINTASLTLVSTSGNIGSTGSSGVGSVLTNAGTVSANTTGNVYVSDSNGSNINLNASTGNSFNVISTASSGNLTVLGALNASGVVFTTSGAAIITNANVISPNISFTTAGAGGITINSQVGTSSGTDSFNSQGSGYITTAQSGASIIGGSLSLVASNGEIGFGIGGAQPLITQANNIVFSAGLSVGISNTSASLNLGASGSNGNVYVYQTGNITANGTINAPVLGLYSFSGSNGVGSASDIIQVNAHNVGFESLNSLGNVYVNDTYNGNVIMQQSQAGIVFKFTTAGPLSIYALIDHGGVVTPGLIQSQIIAFQTLSGYGIYNEAAIQSNDFIFLTASQTGYIAQNTSVGSMIAPNIALVTGGGAIGAGGYITINSANVAASTTGPNGFVYINDSSTNSGIVGGQSGTYFTFNSAGNLNVFGGIGTGAGSGSNLGGSITLNANGIINLGTTSPISLTTNNGSVIVQNNNTSSGQINIANGDFILGSATNANLGFVTMSIGTLTQTNTVNPNPSNIAVQTAGGSNVYFGANGISAISGGNVLFANGRNIVFNTGSLAGSAITLGGKVQITADPPATAAINQAIANTNNVSADSNGLINTNVSFGANSLLNNVVVIGNSLDNQQAGQYVGNPNVNDNQQLTSNLNSFEPIAYNSAVLMNNTTALSDNAKLNNGISLIIAHNDMHFTVNPGINLKLKRGAIVLAIVNNGVISFYNLHDNHDKSVLVSAYNEVLVLNPGSHLSISKFANDFANINPLTKVGYRKLATKTVKGLTLYQSDYSILSLVSSLAPVKALFTSNDRNARLLANQILKTATVVNSTSSFKGIYHQIQKPRLTALK